MKSYLRRQVFSKSLFVLAFVYLKQISLLFASCLVALKAKVQKKAVLHFELFKPLDIYLFANKSSFMSRLNASTYIVFKNYFLRPLFGRIFLELNTSFVGASDLSFGGSFSYPINEISSTLCRTHISIDYSSTSRAIFLFNDSRWESNYFHWHIDFLLLLARAKKIYSMDKIIIVVSTSLKNFQTQSLHALGILPDRIVVLSKISGSNVQLPPKILVEQNRLKVFHPGDYLVTDEIRNLSHSVKKSIAPQTNISYQKIIVSRKDCLTRRLLNQASLFTKFLDKLNFKIVVLSDYDFKTQVSIFSNAKFVIAVHGAGLTNMLYTTNCCLLEIFSLVHGIRPDYMQISRAVGCNYYSYIDPVKRPNADVNLPEHVLKDFLEKNQ